jgi:predicted transcriptional regulator
MRNDETESKQPLGDLQLQVMDFIWAQGSGTVAEVYEALCRKRKIAYTTVLTTMRSLARRGFVSRKKVGKAHLYRPILNREDYTNARLSRLVDDLFDGRREKLLCHLLGSEQLDEAELERIRRILSEQERPAQ